MVMHWVHWTDTPKVRLMADQPVVPLEPLMDGATGQKKEKPMAIQSATLSGPQIGAPLMDGTMGQRTRCKMDRH